MRGKILGAMLMLMCACGGTEPDMVSTHGALCYLNGQKAKKHEIDYMENMLLTIIKRYHGEKDAKEAAACMRDQVVIWDKVPECTFVDSPTRLGCYDGLSGEVHLKLHSCVLGTEYMHEMYHMIQWCAFNKIDTDHSEPIWEIIRQTQRTKLTSTCPW